MDNDAPASWNGVVQTPLRKLWVQCQRVATSMSKVHGLVSGSGYAVATLAVHSSHCLRRLFHAHHHSCPDSTSLSHDRHCAARRGDDPTSGASRAGAWELDPRSLERGSAGVLAGSEILVSARPFPGPQKGGPGPPKKGGAGILNNVNFGGFHRS